MNFNINQNNINANAKTLDELQAQMGDKDNGENAAWLQKLTPGTRAALASGEPLTDAQKSEITYVDSRRGGPAPRPGADQRPEETAQRWSDPVDFRFEQHRNRPSRSVEV